MTELSNLPVAESATHVDSTRDPNLYSAAHNYWILNYLIWVGQIFFHWNDKNEIKLIWRERLIKSNIYKLYGGLSAAESLITKRKQNSHLARCLFFTPMNPILCHPVDKLFSMNAEVGCAPGQFKFRILCQDPHKESWEWAADPNWPLVPLPRIPKLVKDNTLAYYPETVTLLQCIWLNLL